MTHGLHHYHKRKRKERGHSADRNQTIKLLDTLIYIGAFVVPLAYLPQVLKIWILKTAAGVSIISWSAFFLGSLFWLTYGFVHKEKPILILYSLITLLQILILIGIYLYGGF